MNVLVTGGTGFVGREITCQLGVAGHAVRLLARHPNTRVLTQGTTISTGNILDPASLADACAGMDAVIHLVGIISEAGAQTFENVHTRGTENVVRAAQAAGVKRYIQMSALGTRPAARARYHQSKWRAEEIVRSSGLDWTLFRPSIIYGPGDGFVNLFAKIIRRSPIVPVIGNGKTKFQPVPVSMVAGAFVKSLSESAAAGKTFDLAGTETLTLDEIVDSVLQTMKRRRLKAHIPFGIARMQAALLEFVWGKLLRRPPPLNRDQVLMLQEDNVGDGRPATRLFGLEPGYFAESIAGYLTAKNRQIQNRKT
jgi:uncharacterized protein YbjT (DUF2867 family)